MKRTLIINVFLTVFFVLPINSCELPPSDAFVFVVTSAAKRTLDHSVEFVQTTRFDKKCSIGLEYSLTNETKNPWGDVNINIGCLVSNNKTSGHVGLRLNYENTYGLLGSWGHVQGKVYFHHPDKEIDANGQKVVQKLNVFLDYNPETIRKLRVAFDKDNQYIIHQQRILEKNAQAHKLLEQERENKIFLEKKKAFELMPVNTDNQNYRETQDMLQQIQEASQNEN
jgi:hypothetical protein